MTLKGTMVERFVNCKKFKEKRKLLYDLGTAGY